MLDLFRTARMRVAIALVDPAIDDLYRVTACIDASKVNLVDMSGKSVVPPEGPRRVTYDYTVEKDRQKWYVIEER